MKLVVLRNNTLPSDEAVEAAARAYYEDDPQVRPSSDRRDQHGNWLDYEPMPWDDYIAKKDDPNDGTEERRYARDMLTAAYAIDLPRVRAEERAATLRAVEAHLLSEGYNISAREVAYFAAAKAGVEHE